jgi:hypothetical protein
VIPGDLEVVQTVAHLVVTLPVTAVVLLRDERKLVGAQLARAWSPSSRDAALLTFYLSVAGLTPLVLAIHWTRTRRSLAGAAIGLALATAVFGLGLAAQLGVELAVDWLGL